MSSKKDILAFLDKKFASKVPKTESKPPKATKKK